MMNRAQLAERLEALAAWHDPATQGRKYFPFAAHEFCRAAARALVGEVAAPIGVLTYEMTTGRVLAPVADTPEAAARLAALPKGTLAYAAPPPPRIALHALTDARIAEIVGRYVLPQQAMAYTRAVERAVRQAAL